MNEAALTVDAATKLFGPAGAVGALLVAALIYVFKLYHAAQGARIEDAKSFAAKQEAINDRILPYVARLARRTERVARAVRLDDSDPPEELESRISRSAIDREGTSTPRVKP